MLINIKTFVGNYFTSTFAKIHFIMNFPESLKYTQEHEWVKLDGEFAYVGITEFAQSELGDIVFVDIDCVGEHIKKDAIFGSVEAVKTVSDLFMPLDAEVLELNSKLNSEPELVNTDPYGDGWMIKVKLSNPSDYDMLLSSESYRKLINK